MTPEDAERRRLAALSVESEDLNIVQVEILYRTKWRRFEMDPLALQHLRPEMLWDRYLIPALKAVDAPDPVKADPVNPESSQVDGAVIVVGAAV